MDVTKPSKEAASKISRLPLGPSERNINASHRNQAREVSSRYRTPIPTTTIKRSSSPILPTASHDSSHLVSRRAQSTERKRPSSSSVTAPLIRHSSIDAHLQSRRLGRSPEGLWPSMRTLSVSFQSDTISIPITKKEKPPLDNPFRAHLSKQNESTLRVKYAPDQRGMLIEQNRWPGRIGGKLSPSKSLDLVDHNAKSFVSSAELLDSLLTSFSDRIPSSSSSSHKVTSNGSRSASPAKSCSSRGVSPTRSRPSTPPSRGGSPSKGRVTQQSNSSVLSFMVDVKKGKKGASHIEEAHHLRLLYNRYMQWRFVNARAETVYKTQKISVEKVLHDVWKGILRLRESVAQKNVDIHQLRLELKLNEIFNGQRWSLLEQDHMDVVSKAVFDLKAATVRVPVIRGAKVDKESLRVAIDSAIDVMRVIVSSITDNFSNIQNTDVLMSDLANLTANERLMLNHCESLLASFAALLVEECSQQTQLIQLTKESTSMCP